MGSDLGPNWKGLSAGDNVMLIFNAKLNISVQLQLIITFEVSNSLDQNPVEKAQVICVSLWSKQLDPHPPGKKLDTLTPGKMLDPLLNLKKYYFSLK